MPIQPYHLCQGHARHCFIHDSETGGNKSSCIMGVRQTPMISLQITFISSKQPRLTNLQGTSSCDNSCYQIYAENSTEPYICSQWHILSSLSLPLVMERDFRRSKFASYQWLYKNAWDSAVDCLLLFGAVAPTCWMGVLALMDACAEVGIEIIPNTHGMTSSANTLALMIPKDRPSGRNVTIWEYKSSSKRRMSVSVNDPLGTSGGVWET